MDGLTLKQARSYAVIALNKMIINGKIKGNSSDLLPLLDYEIFNLVEWQGISPEAAEQQAQELRKAE